MVGGPRLRPSNAVILALVLTACSSGPGGGDAVPREARPTSTTVGGFAVHDDVVVGDPQTESAPASRSPATTIAGKPAAPTGGEGGLPPPSGSTSTTTTATTTTTLPPGLPAEKCPQPKSCRYYKFLTADPYRWPTGPDGRATVEYWVNPAGATAISVEDVEGAVAAAFVSWERAAPTLRFVYRGRTDRLAAPRDGTNVVAFDGDHNYTWVSSSGEFDIHFVPGNWAWAPCEQRDGACTDDDDRTADGEAMGVAPPELQSLATHEVGHAMGLDHPPADPAYAELTMKPTFKRSKSTLALGDVLGIRALYPCDCPLPPIYDP
jgi:hypothetical protein